MAFDLFLRFRGLFLFMPDTGHPYTDIVVIRPKNASHHGEHRPKMTADGFKVELDDHDIRFFDGANQLYGPKGSGRHTYSGLPKLKSLVGTGPLIPGLRLGEQNRPSLCAARLRIVDGAVSTEVWSKEVWQLEEDLNPPVVLPDSVGLLAIEIEFRREIQSSALRVVFQKRGVDMPHELKPDGDALYVTITNLPKMNPKRDPTLRNKSPHIQALCDVAQSPGRCRNIHLVERSISTALSELEMRGTHLPCVGACSAC